MTPSPYLLLLPLQSPQPLHLDDRRQLGSQLPRSPSQRILCFDLDIASRPHISSATVITPHRHIRPRALHRWDLKPPSGRSFRAPSATSGHSRSLVELGSPLQNPTNCCAIPPHSTWANADGQQLKCLEVSSTRSPLLTIIKPPPDDTALLPSHLSLSTTKQPQTCLTPKARPLLARPPLPGRLARTLLSRTSRLDLPAPTR